MKDDKDLKEILADEIDAVSLKDLDVIATKARELGFEDVTVLRPGGEFDDKPSVDFGRYSVEVSNAEGGLYFLSQEHDAKGFWFPRDIGEYKTLEDLLQAMSKLKR